MVIFLFLFASFFVIITGGVLLEIEEVQNMAKNVGKFEEAEYLKQCKGFRKGKSSSIVSKNTKMIRETLLADVVESKDLLVSSLLLKQIINSHNELLW